MTQPPPPYGVDPSLGQAPGPTGQYSAVPEDEPWRRLHPLTPVVRGWKVLAAALVVIGQQRGPAMFSEGMPSGPELAFGFMVLIAAVVLGGIYVWLAWQRAEYRVGPAALELRTGVLFRSERQARLDRLQAVDVVRPILARFFGLAELRLEVAGGSDSGVRLSLLPEAQAQALRNTLLARAAGLRYEGRQAPEAPEREVLTVPVGRVVEATVRSSGTVITVLLSITVVVASVLTRSIGPLFGLGPIALGFGTALWQRFSTSFGFRVALSPDGIRLHHGLLTTRAQTVPPGRIQAVRLSQPLLWRDRDWWRLEVNIAGYGGHGGEEGHEHENVLLAVGTRTEAIEVLALAMPMLDRPGPSDPSTSQGTVGWLRAVEAGMTGRGGAGGYVASPPVARWLDPIGWRRHGVLVADQVLLARRGVLVRQLDVVPHARTQSLGLVQGPLQRLLGLASFALHSTRGPVSPSVAHLPAEQAAMLLHQQAERARTARADHTREGDGRWMLRRPDGPTLQEPGS